MVLDVIRLDFGRHPLRQFLPLRAGFSFGRSSPYSFCPPNASALGSSGARSWTVAQAPFRPRCSGGGNRDQRHPATPAGSVPFLGNEAGQRAGIVGDPPRHAQRPHAAPDAFPPGQPASQAADGQTHDVAPSATSRAVKPSDNSRSVPRRWELRNSTLAARSDGHPSLTPLSKPECPPHPRTLHGPCTGNPMICAYVNLDCFIIRLPLTDSGSDQVHARCRVSASSLFAHAPKSAGLPTGGTGSASVSTA